MSRLRAKLFGLPEWLPVDNVKLTGVHQVIHREVNASLEAFGRRQTQAAS